MKRSIALLCLFSPLTAFASEDFIINASVAETRCQPMSGISACITSFDQNEKNIVIPLSECSDPNNGWTECTGKWEGSRTLSEHEIQLRMNVRKSSYPDLSGKNFNQYELTAQVKEAGADWRTLHVMTGERGALTDTAQIDGAELTLSPGITLTPGLTVGPALR